MVGTLAGEMTMAMIDSEGIPPVDPLEEEYLKISEVAGLLRISDRQVRYAVDLGYLKAVRPKGKGDGPIRIPKSAVRVYLVVHQPYSAD